jgi:hypothetical protein
MRALKIAVNLALVGVLVWFLRSPRAEDACQRLGTRLHRLLGNGGPPAAPPEPLRGGQRSGPRDTDQGGVRNTSGLAGAYPWVRGIRGPGGPEEAKKQVLQEFRVVPGINGLLASLINLEAQWLVRGHRLPFGTSLVVVARRAP